MPLFDANILDSDPDGAALLAALLHPSPRARAAALTRGRRRLAGSAAESLAVGAPGGVSETVRGERMVETTGAKPAGSRTVRARAGRVGTGRPRPSLGAA